MRPIDADALIMALRLEYPMMPMFKENQKEWEIKTDGYRKAEEVIRNSPTIEPKRGEWIEYESDTDKYDDIRCSCCQRLFTVDSYHFTDIGFTKDDLNFCPSCGAMMEGADDEHDK